MSLETNNRERDMRLHLLDMGDEKYGDCIVIVNGRKKVVVDGEHIGDFRSRGPSPGSKGQVTRHIGCGARGSAPHGLRDRRSASA
jgi:hypothetical protein